MSVHHKCRDNVPYCPGDRVSIVSVDTLLLAFVQYWGASAKNRRAGLQGVCSINISTPQALHPPVPFLYNRAENSSVRLK